MNSKKLFIDEHFKNGFTILEMEHAPDGGYIHLGDVTFPESTGKPSWLIAQWYSKHCLWKERKPTDRYTITDGTVKTVKYNPEDSSVSMRLNARAVYEGKPHIDGMWPHLLLEQEPMCDYDKLSEEDKAFYRTDCDKLMLELDIRMPAYEDTTNTEGVNACQFMAYFYMKLMNTNRKIWFGVNLFDNRGLIDTYWNIDLVGTEMIYCISTADTFGGAEKSFNNTDTPCASDEWKEIRLDLTEHLDKVVELINRDNTFGRKVSRSDFYIGGNNIGFEIHGNFDCTFDIRNYNLIAYNK